jgi:tetratricopeptide (TPR) repeat protein
LRALALKSENKLTQALQCYNQTISISTPYPDLKANAYNSIGVIYNIQNQLLNHLIYIDSALTTAKQYKLIDLENRFILNKAHLIFYMGKKKEAIQLSYLLIDRLKQRNDFIELCIAYNNLAIYYRLSGNMDSAFYCCSTSLNIAKTGNHPFTHCRCRLRNGLLF